MTALGSRKINRKANRNSFRSQWKTATQTVNGTAILSGKPTAKGAFTFTIVVSDDLLPEATQLFDLTVA